MSTDLRAIQERADNIRAECERILEDEATKNAPWQPALAKLHAVAGRVSQKAGEPVRLGIVGDFSAGKTLLLGALLGHADGLPISEDPTTGNITAVNLIQAAGTTTTEYTNHRISFLTRDEFVECLGFMLQKALERSAKAEIDGSLQSELKTIKADSGATVLSKIETWCGRAWENTRNPSLLFLIRELVGFVRAYHKCGAGLCEADQTFPVDASTVANGLELPKNTKSIQELSFSDLPVPALSLSYRPSELSIAHIQAAFPLVRQVTIDALVSQGVWRFGEVESNPFMLLDFPGLGAESSGVRDLYLSLRELNRIQTILITLTSKQPGGDSGSAVYNLLQEHRPGQNIRDMILVAATRFDELPLQDKEAQLRAYAKPDSLVPSMGAKPAKAKGARANLGDDEDDAPAPKSPATAAPTGSIPAFLKEYSILGTCVSGGEALVPQDRSDRVLLISSMAHVRFLRDKNETFTVASPEFLSTYHGTMEKADEWRTTWGAVAKRLASESSGGDAKSKSLIDRLTEFGIDGGIGLLRKQMLSHVNLHGRAQLVKDVNAAYETELGQALKSLRDQLPNQSVQNNPVQKDLQQNLANQLQEISRYLSNEKRSLENAPRMQIQVEDRPVDLEEILTDEVVFRISDWPQWQRLFSSAKEGIIDPASTKDILGSDDDDDDDDSIGCPFRSEDFFASFQKVISDLETFTLELLERGLDEWIAKLSRSSSEIRQIISEPLRKPELAAELKKMRLGEKGRGLLNALKAIIDPPRMKSIFAPNDGGISTLPVSKSDSTTLFPLARGASSRRFGWAPENAKLPDASKPDRNLSHMAMVLRLKEEITALALQQMQQMLSEGMQLVIGGQPNLEDGGRDGGMLAGLAAINERAAFLAGNSLVLDAVLRPSTPEDQATTADPLLDAVKRLADSKLAF